MCINPPPGKSGMKSITTAKRDDIRKQLREKVLSDSKKLDEWKKRHRKSMKDDDDFLYD